MPRLILVDSGSTPRVLKRIGIPDSGGTPRMLKRMFECDANGTPRLIYESLRAGIQPANVSGSAAAGNPSGTVTSAAASCAGAGSNGVYTYSWVCSGCTATSPNSASTTFYATVDAGATDNASAYCEISDGVNSVDTDTIAVALTNTTPAFSGQIDTYAIPGTYTETIPTGASTLIVEVWGAGGSGAGLLDSTTGVWTPGGGGGAGGYSRSDYNVSSNNGQTISVTVGSGGVAVDNGSGVQGGPSSAASGTFPMTSMTGDGAAGGTVDTGGPGASASGGNYSNVSGGSGAAPALGAAGGTPVSGYAGESYGGGGTASTDSVQPSNGGNGAVRFTYT